MILSYQVVQLVQHLLSIATHGLFQLICIFQLGDMEAGALIVGIGGWVALGWFIQMLRNCNGCWESKGLIHSWALLILLDW